jgi:hypothetical protein
MDTHIGKYVLIRTESAGVHVGTLASRTGNEIVLANASRIWRCRGANTLHELALHGPNREQYTRISERVPKITIIGVIEIIPTTEAAFMPVWNDR